MCRNSAIEGPNRALFYLSLSAFLYKVSHPYKGINGVLGL